LAEQTKIRTLVSAHKTIWLCQ